MNTNLKRGIKELGAIERDSEDGKGDYAYFADETQRWYAIDESDVETLGEMLADGVSSAYSVWCSETDSVEVPDPRDGVS